MQCYLLTPTHNLFEHVLCGLARVSESEGTCPHGQESVQRQVWRGCPAKAPGVRGLPEHTLQSFASQGLPSVPGFVLGAGVPLKRVLSKRQPGLVGWWERENVASVRTGLAARGLHSGTSAVGAPAAAVSLPELSRAGAATQLRCGSCRHRGREGPGVLMEAQAARGELWTQLISGPRSKLWRKEAGG